MDRRKFLGSTVAAGFVGALVVLKPFHSAEGQDMRIETEVYAGKSRQPVFENMTLFSGNSVYDFSRTGPEKITVYDRRRGKFVLLNVEEETKVILDREKVEGYVDLLKSREELKRKEPFLFNPSFEEKFDESSNQLTLSSDEMTYRIVGTPSKREESFEAYVDFINWYSKLSATDPRQMPPFARLELNQALERHKLIPKEVERIYKPSNNLFGNRIQAKTKHYVVWQLSSKDRQRIDSALDHVTRFQEVSLSEFYGLKPVAVSSR
ncbi:MAG: hypothetical protein VX768_02835 [Planctomycetota bacterium]|nr:hypothetical protein [Planctomycetota bacterium]